MPINTIIIVLLALILLVSIVELLKKFKRNPVVWRRIKRDLGWLIIFMGIFIGSQIRVLLMNAILWSSHVYNVDVQWYSLLSFKVGDYQNNVVLLNSSALIGLVGSIYWIVRMIRNRKD
ncbi:MAG: hypothetical protein K2G70_04335 [Turicibacter sp.]|nr:hypothetical protein [Turicibacter sp.]